MKNLIASTKLIINSTLFILLLIILITFTLVNTEHIAHIDLIKTSCAESLILILKGPGCKSLGFCRPDRSAFLILLLFTAFCTEDLIFFFKIYIGGICVYLIY